MDLTNEIQVSAFLKWVKRTEDIETASACEQIIRDACTQNRCHIENSLELVESARQIVHGEEIVQARQLANTQLDS
ncbi:MAG: hypothetical protein KAS32_15435 [Candidatus Peribacteraceae bacterium]|nr:hypothetical protein [Candidatus Peribacteraceae bacterium]